MFEGLFTYGFDLTVLPGLAASWETSDDNLTFTVQLKPDVRWHDGEAFDFADVVTSFNVMAAANPNLAVIAPQVASVEATGPLEVTFSLKNPVPALAHGLSLGGMPIIPDHIYGGARLSATILPTTRLSAQARSNWPSGKRATSSSWCATTIIMSTASPI